MQMLNGAATLERRVLLRWTLHTMFQINFLKEAEVEEIR